MANNTWQSEGMTGSMVQKATINQINEQLVKPLYPRRYHQVEVVCGYVSTGTEGVMAQAMIA